jgi:hypothetical protein
MNIYLDDDITARPMVVLLRKAGHQVTLPADVGTAGASDPVHLTYAAEHGLVILTRNAKDYEELHRLIQACHGKYAGMLLVKADDNKKHRMKYAAIVRAIGNIEKAGVELANQMYELNHWQ